MSKWVTGVRKIWGIRKKESCDDVAKGLVRAVGKLPFGFSVGKRVSQVNGKSGWWFIVRTPESCLLETRNGITSNGGGRWSKGMKVLF